MVGHLLLFHPALAHGARADRLAASSARSTTCTPTARTSARCAPTRTRSGASAPHDVAVLLDLVGERPIEASARGECYVRPGVEDVVFGYLQFPSGVDRAPAPVVARPAQDAQADGRRLARRWSSSTTWRPTARSRSTTRASRAAAAPTPTASTSACASATSRSRASAPTSRCGSSARSSSTRSASGRAPRCRRRARAWRSSRCWRRMQRSLERRAAVPVELAAQ